jgi:hypothetical protein
MCELCVNHVSTMCQMGYFSNETHMFHTWLTHGLAIFYPSARFSVLYNCHSSRIICCSSRIFLNPVPEKAANTYNACYSFRVFAKPVPGLAKAPSIFQQPGIFDGTFVSLIGVDEASLNAKQEERLEWHAESAIINMGIIKYNTPLFL